MLKRQKLFFGLCVVIHILLKKWAKKIQQGYLNFWAQLYVFIVIVNSGEIFSCLCFCIRIFNQLKLIVQWNKLNNLQIELTVYLKYVTHSGHQFHPAEAHSGSSSGHFQPPLHTCHLHHKFYNNKKNILVITA